MGKELRGAVLTDCMATAKESLLTWLGWLRIHAGSWEALVHAAREKVKRLGGE